MKGNMAKDTPFLSIWRSEIFYSTLESLRGNEKGNTEIKIYVRDVKLNFIKK